MYVANTQNIGSCNFHNFVYGFKVHFISYYNAKGDNRVYLVTFCKIYNNSYDKALMLYLNSLIIFYDVILFNGSTTTKCVDKNYVF